MIMIAGGLSYVLAHGHVWCDPVTCVTWQEWLEAGGDASALLWRQGQLSSGFVTR